MELTKIIESHQYYYFEKYYSIAAELFNLSQIINTYTDKGILDKTFHNIINDLKDKIAKDFKIIKNFQDNDFIIFLMEIDKAKIEMEKLLHYMDLIHNKTIQAITESSPHIHPLPPIQKRYSSKVLSGLLNEHHQTLFDILSGLSQNSNILSLWSHNDNYQINDLPGLNTYMSQHSYFYHDIAWNIPAIIDHEIILKSIQNNEDINTLISKQANDIKTNFTQVLEKTPRVQEHKNHHLQWQLYYQEFEDFIQNNIEKIFWELSADYIGYIIHGEAYLISFLHETLGEYFGREFYNGTIRDDRISMGISIQRESLLLRHFILLSLVDLPQGGYLETLRGNLYDTFFTPNKINTNRLDKWMEAKSSIKTVDQAKKDEIHLQITEAHEYHLIIIEIARLILTTFDKKTITDYIQKEDLNKFKENSSFFDNNKQSIANYLWGERFKALPMLPHRSILRQQLIKNLGHNIEAVAYVMQYRYSSKSNLIEGKTINFGNYSDISIDEITSLTFDIQEKIDDCINMIDNSTKFFQTKHTLLKISSLFNEPISSNNIYTLYMLIYLKEDNPDSTISLINDISCNLKQMKDTLKISNCNIYKSFGPEDIVLEAQFTADTTIWNFIEQIRTENKNKIYETFSSITINNLDTSSLMLGDNMWVKSYYRVPTGITFKDFYTHATDYEKLTILIQDDRMQIFDLSNKYYDFEVWWTRTPIEDINNFSASLFKNGICIEAQHFLTSNQNNIHLLSKKNKKPSPKG